MKQTKDKIEKEYKRMWNWLQENDGKDEITERMVYAMSELLRWSIEDTVDWQKPLEQAISNSEILKEDLKHQ